MSLGDGSEPRRGFSKCSTVYECKAGDLKTDLDLFNQIEKQGSLIKLNRVENVVWKIKGKVSCNVMIKILENGVTVDFIRGG